MMSNDGNEKKYKASCLGDMIVFTLSPLWLDSCVLGSVSYCTVIMKDENMLIVHHYFTKVKDVDSTILNPQCLIFSFLRDFICKK